MIRFWFPTRPGSLVRRSAIGLAAVLAAGAVAGVALWGSFNAVLEHTNSLEFCISCHEMKDTVYAEYKQSVHFQNASGVRAICSDCHVPRDFGHKLLRKIQASGELYHKLVGTVSTPDKFEEHRLELAQSVWASMAANKSRECRNCHAFEAMDFHKQRKEAADRMPKAMAEGETCIACHKGIAHKLPDMAQGYRQTFKNLQAAAKTESAKATVLYTIATTPFFLERGDASRDSAGDGKLLAASRLEVVARDGDWLKVTIAGWQQEGAERVLYAMQGQRILNAALGAGAIDKVAHGKSMQDPNTDQTWTEGSVVAWVAKDALIADLQKIWSYGAEMYAASCTMCHSLRPTDHYLANQWVGNLNAMRRFITLDDEQYRLLQKYLQFHAKDTKDVKAAAQSPPRGRDG